LILRSLTDPKLRKKAVYTLFAVYVLLALNILFFIRSSLWSYYTYGEYFRENTNFVPFRAVAEFMSYMRDRNSYYHDMSFDNLVGNILIFLPSGVFLPALWKKQRRFRAFALTTAALIIGVEAVQFLTMCGSCDIDDFILNFFGAVIGYTLSRLKIIRKLMFISKE